LRHFDTNMQPVNFFTTLALLIVVASGCSKSDGRVKVYPVSGKVSVRGTPAEGARVVFYPVSDELKKPGMPIPYGITDSAGDFKLRSYDIGDGAPEGEYKIGIIWLDSPPEKAEENPLGAKDRLSGQYSNPQSSKLTAKVEKGGGEIPPFELQ
jgi:hypothetical protein